MYMLIAAALAISLIIIAAPAQKVSADPDVHSEWSRVPTPSTENWVLAPDSVIMGFAPADGGAVAYALVYGWDSVKDEYGYWLLKSTDDAATWKNISDAVTKEVSRITDIPEADVDLSLVSVATDYVDPDFVAVALQVDGELHVFVSKDGGATFRDTGEVEDGSVKFTAGDVFDFAVSAVVDGVRDIAIGGTDGSTGLLFRCDVTGDRGGDWEDATQYGDDWEPCSAVVDIHFTFSWAADKTILVSTATDTTVLLQAGTWGTVEGWNEDSTLAIEPVTIISGVTIPWASLRIMTAGINTPMDYSGRNADSRYAWVNVNYLVGSTPVGEIFRVKNKSVTTVNQQIEDMPWLTNVHYMGYIAEGKAIAGVLGDGFGSFTDCCEGVQVYRNDGIANMDICCITWEEACKPPTGTFVMAAFYVSPDKAYAVALFGFDSYEEGACSVSFDDGDTWNQLSLIDTNIDYLSDVAVSLDCNKTMLVSINLDSGCGCDSVWLYADNLPEASEYSDKWLRTWCGELGDEQYGLLRLAPEETTGDTVYLVDRGTSTVYWNEMETLACWNLGSAATVSDIVDLAVKAKDTIYALDQSGSVAMSDDYSVGWNPVVDSKVDEGWTIAVLGDDILVGGRDGDVSYSDDGGETFTELEKVATTGYVTVAFDSYFNTNDTIYAAVIEEGDAVPGANGIYRWVIGESIKWRDLNVKPSTFQLTGAGSKTDSNEVGFTGLVLDRPAPGNPMTSADTGGVLYASYVTEIGGEIVTGVARCLTPAQDVCCGETSWDYLIVGLTADGEAFYMMPKALKICGCLTADSNSKLFAIDGLYAGDGPGYDMAKARDGTVWTFEDCYAKAAPDLKSPAEGATIASHPCDCGNVGFTFKWDRQCDACEYDILIATDEDFTEIVYDSALDNESYLPSAPSTPSYLVAIGALSSEVTYYWKVRSAKAETGQVIHSWWSEPRSLTVAPGPNTGLNLNTPETGATDVAITNVAFTWTPVASADAYDWVLSPNANLSSPTESKTELNTTAYTCTKTLAYDTTYYWQVTAYKEGAAISVSTIGTFRTMPKPAEADGVQPVPTPVWVWVVIAIGAVLVIVVIVLIFRTRRV